uniref:Matrix-remodeling-associated protein 7 helical domain-containing protein n=1 Tax=Coturnix japonica TaxID=93934 RepID=A0A8C2UEU3_COTJA
GDHPTHVLVVPASVSSAGAALPSWQPDCCISIPRAAAVPSPALQSCGSASPHPRVTVAPLIWQLGRQLRPMGAGCPSQVLSVSHHLLLSFVLPSPAADETFSFKYSPGKLRGNQYKSMMTKEELEEEQRVQREQLAAIFRLMKEKSDTFGEMSEGDMKEQLKLYDI